MISIMLTRDPIFNKSCSTCMQVLLLCITNPYSNRFVTVYLKWGIFPEMMIPLIHLISCEVRGFEINYILYIYDHYFLTTSETDDNLHMNLRMRLCIDI